MTTACLPAARDLQEALDAVRATVKRNRIFMVHAGADGSLRELTYGEVLDRIARLGGLYVSWGLRPGDRVLVASSDDGTLATLILSLLYHGFCAVIGDAGAPGPEMAPVLDVARPSAAIVDEGLRSRWPLEGVARVLPIVGAARSPGRLWAKLLGARGPAEPKAATYPAILASLPPAEPAPSLSDESEAYVLFTSGSTSRPKGVRISRRSLRCHALTIARHLGLRPESRVHDVLPLSHADGLIHGCLVPWLTGAAVLRPMRWAMDRVGELLDGIYTHRATHFVAVPAMLAIIDRYGDGHEEAFATEDFQFIVSVAGYLEAPLWERFRERFKVRVANIYGLTETVTGGLFCGPGDSGFRLGTVGRPVDCRVRIVDDSGNDLPPGEKGELLIGGDLIMMGYLRDDGSGASALDGGWLHTGDMATVDGDGFYRIVGRRKNIVVTGGLNVQPEEVTGVLRGIPGVQDAVAFGVDDPTFGQVLGACVVPEDGGGLTAARVAAACRERLSEFKVPRIIGLIPALPRGPSGKVVLAQARDLLLRSQRSPAAASGGNVNEAVLAVAGRAFRVAAAELSAESKPASTPGWDSFAHLAFIVELEGAFGVRFTTAEILGVRSLGDAQRLVRHKTVPG